MIRVIVIALARYAEPSEAASLITEILIDRMVQRPRMNRKSSHKAPITNQRQSAFVSKTNTF